jgi:SPP1 gp7 family putative phage head morphogenesis protein
VATKKKAPAPKKTIIQTANEFRVGLLKDDAVAANKMIEAYADVYDETMAQIAKVQAELAAQPPSLPISPQALKKLDIFRRAQFQVEGAMLKYAQFASADITQRQKAIIEEAKTHAEHLIEAGLGSVPIGDITPGKKKAFRAVQAELANIKHKDLQVAIGFQGDGSPLLDTLKKFGEDAGAQFGKALINGVAQGKHPTQIAREARKVMTLPLAQSLTVARTEVLRSYREATHQLFEDSHVVMGWRWMAALNSRCCGMCIALHGQTFHTQERMATHPNCRCVMVPVTTTWNDIAGTTGIPEPKLHLGTGAQWLDSQSEDVQKSVLGGATFRAYKGGFVTLGDLVGKSTDPTWGHPYYLKSLKEVLGSSHAASMFYQKGKSAPPIPPPSAPVPTPTPAPLAPTVVQQPKYSPPTQYVPPAYTPPTPPPPPPPPVPPPAPTVVQQPQMAPAQAGFIQNPLVHPDGKSAIAWAKSHWQDPTQMGMTTGEKDALVGYSGASFKMVNDYLRKGASTLPYSVTEPQMKEFIKNMDSGLNRYTAPQDFRVVRGSSTSAFAGVPMDQIAGRVFTEKGFLSTSVGNHVVAGWSGKPVIMHINVPKGTPAYYLANVSHYPLEREMLLGRGLKYIVKSSVYNKATGKWEVEVDVVLPTTPEKKPRAKKEK